MRSRQHRERQSGTLWIRRTRTVYKHTGPAASHQARQGSIQGKNSSESWKGIYHVMSKVWKKIPFEVDVGDGDLLLFPLISDLSGGIGDEGEEEEGGVDDQLHDHAAQLLLHPLLDLSGHLHYSGREAGTHESWGWQVAKAGNPATGQSQFQNTRQVILAVSVMEHVSI